MGAIRSDNVITHSDFQAHVNIMAIAILSRGKCGLSKCITHYLVAMAVADLLVVIIGVILNRVIGIYLPVSALSITPVCRLKTVLVYASRNCSVWLTVAFTFDRCVVICCQKLRTTYCTMKTAAVVVGTVFALSYLQNIPWYFVLEPVYFINNVPMYCGIKSSFYILATWIAFSWINHILTPCLAILLILLFNVLTVRHILASSRVRRALRGINSAEYNIDPELESRKKSIILLFSISGSFVMLWATYTVHHLYYRITTTYVYTGYNDPVFILQESGHMLLLLSCCTNTCIYVVTQNKFREEMKNVVKYLLALIVKFVK
ncbi:probable G-protein coupled receptor 139 [Heptranchias perlo]|uniref:probable G-protein coupled receptor 139 n=1 Tax=Heptranchias perlo TaxID=212740 RepID=UPI003559611E